MEVGQHYPETDPNLKRSSWQEEYDKLDDPEKFEKEGCGNPLKTIINIDCTISLIFE